MIEEVVEPGRKFTELTFCFRQYHLAYDVRGDSRGVFYMTDGESAAVDLGLWNTTRGKELNFIAIYPMLQPYDFIVWFYPTRKGFLEIEKNAFSFFRKGKQRTLASQWQNICLVYSVPKKNIGLVLNGETIGSKNFSDSWANDDNYFTSRHFEPVHLTDNGFGYNTSRYLILLE